MPYYAVRNGREPGVYNSWSECRDQVDQFSHASYQKFSTAAEARAFASGGSSQPYYSSSRPNQLENSHTSQPAPSPARLLVTLASLPRAPPAVLKETTNAFEQVQVLKGSNDEKELAEQYRKYVSQAEEQIKTIPKGRKRAADDANQKEPSLYNEAGYGGAADVYTDGACHSNGRYGSRAGVGVYWGQGDSRNVSERASGRQTNNSAEIEAATRAIEQAKAQGIRDLNLHTDSEFTIKGATQWTHKWKQNDWKLSTGGDVKNRAEFERLDDALSDGQVNVNWRHVSGHSGNRGNQAADRLANRGARY